MTDIDFINEYTNNERPLTKEKIDYFNSKSRLKGFIGPRQCGKTYTLFQDLACNAFHVKGNYLVLAPNFPNLLSVRLYLGRCLEQFATELQEIERSFVHTSCRLPNGSTVTFTTSMSEGVDFVKGKIYHCVYIDEPRLSSDFDYMVDHFLPIVTRFNGYIGVFGTIEESFNEYLKNKGFDLYYHLD